MAEGKTIRDPIHGNIKLDSLETRLVDTREMQRLRRIKQNGFCYLIYPAMNSTRFEHSLGVMYLAGLVAEHLKLNKEERKLLRVASLLHDIGHCAFSHTSDELLKKFKLSHEENSARIILNSEISDILKEEGLDSREVANLIKGKGALSKLISSEIDIDKMDYLIRDSYYAGVAYGVIDLERVIQGIKLMKDSGEVVVKKGSLEAVESLLISRNLMYQTVYRHHTKRITENMFQHALICLLETNEIKYENFVQMDDLELIHKLRNSKGYGRDIMQRIDDRKLFKIFFQEKISLISENFRGDMEKNVNELEKKISKDFKIPKGYLLLDLPEMKFSEFKILVETENKELKKIDEVSILAQTLEKSEWEKLNFCFYTPREYMKKLKDFNAERYIEFSQTRLRKFF